MVKLNPYLTFNGNAREAMEFYKAALGGELSIQTVAESPMAKQLDKKFHSQVMHAMLAGKDFCLMASDVMDKGPAKAGDHVSLSLNCESDEEIKRLFGALSKGGKVTMPLADMFWGASFGMLSDKFGMHWMLNFQKTPLGGM